MTVSRTSTVLLFGWPIEANIYYSGQQ